jgi:ABC-type nitrate/sulfonate/bicarbonate transport system substrate-binding protein
MSTRQRVILSSIIAVAVLAAIVVLADITEDDPQEEIRIAHTGSPHLAPLYAAFGHGIFEDKGLQISLKQFGSSTDAGFALLSGRVDAAFLEPSKSFRLINENDDLDIKIAGSVNYDFGATLIVREGLNVRLNDVEGLTIAAGSRYCLLLSQFKHDAQRYGVDTEKINFVYLDFAFMLPALEAGKIDGMITRASYALPAQKHGHIVLYQNWDVSPGDACCPAYLAQVEFFLLVKDINPRSVGLLDSALAKTSELPAEIKRDAIARFTQYPSELLAQKHPVAYYMRVSQELKQELGGWVWTQN